MPDDFATAGIAPARAQRLRHGYLMAEAVAGGGGGDGSVQGLGIAAELGQLDERLVGGLFLVEQLLDQTGGLLAAEQQGPLTQAAVGGDLLMLDLLRAGDEGGIERGGDAAVRCADLHAVRYPADKLAELYFRRWSIELFYRDIKTTMCMEAMRTKTPEIIEKELHMHALAYNCIRALILEGASTHQQELGRISFKGAVGLLRQWLPHAAHIHEQPRKLTHWQAQLLEAISSIQNPLRPGRREPRATKRRPKSYQLLTRPRHQFHEIQHRDHYRATA